MSAREEELTGGEARGVTAVDGTTKARIERAALSLFARGEMDQATTRAIAGEAGISEGALYRHYRSKAEIWENLFFSIHRRLGTLVTEAGDKHETLGEQVGAMVDAYCSTADDDWQLFAFHLLSMHRFLPGPEGDVDPVSAAENITARAMARGDIPKGDTVLITAMALGIVLQPALHKAYGRLGGQMKEHQPALTRAVIAALNSTPGQEG